MREAAKITRICFGIAKFSASTICRVNKKLKLNINELTAVFNCSCDKLPCGDDDDNFVAALGMLDEPAKGNITCAPKHDNQEEVKASQPAPTKFVLLSVFNTPLFNEFIGKVINRKPIQPEKIRFKEYIGRCCRKYYLLNRQLLI
jgi:hypothetical protein